MLEACSAEGVPYLDLNGELARISHARLVDSPGRHY